MTVDELLERLEGVRSSGGGFVALCPAHGDSEPSLSIHEGENEILLKCHTGCTTEQIVSALKIEMADLFFGARARKGMGNMGEPEAVYSYTDEQGNELFQALRFPGKHFRQRHLGEDGEWVWNTDGVKKVLYHLPEVMQAVATGQPIWIVEGEKDVEALRAMGQVATCNPGGAGGGKWKDEYAQVFQGAHVIIVQDRDEVGRNHAARVRRSLQGIASQIYVVQAKTGKDAYDHIFAGHTLQEFEPAKQRAERGVTGARELAREMIERMETPEEHAPKGFDPLADVLPGVDNPPEFMPGRVYPIGAYTGEGKSAIAIYMARKLAESGVKVGFFTLEMPKVDLQTRLLQHKGIPQWYLDHPWKIPGTQWEQIYRDAVAEISDWPLDIIDESAIDVEGIRRYVENREHEFVFVDHVHRFSWGGERRKLESELQDLTNIALDYSVPLVLCAQLRRFTRGQGMEYYPRPSLQDFRETEMIGMEAARAMALWRPRTAGGLEYDSARPGVELIVLKDRHGPLRSWLVDFDGPTQIFRPLPPKAVAEPAPAEGPAWMHTDPSLPEWEEDAYAVPGL